MGEEHDQVLRRAWEAFCDELKRAGDIPLRAPVPPHATDRAAGFEALARNISLALNFHHDYADPRYPELIHYFDPVRKQGGDNTDAVYVGATINGTDTYRISGDRGSAPYFAVTAVERGQTPWGGKVAHTLFDHDLQVEPDGRFELVCSPEPHPGNWLRTTPETFRVTFRQFFADWEHERPMKARIDRLSGDTSPPAPLTPEKLAAQLSSAAKWVGESIAFWVRMIEMWKVMPNTFRSYKQLADRAIDATPGGEPMIAYWALPPDEALVVRVRPPVCRYWAVEFGNFWWTTMDYRYRLSNTNCHYAQLEDDGELVVVIAHEDPGLPNWLDTSGFAEGYVTYRWMLAQGCPEPQAVQVKTAQLHRHLPPNVKRITPEARREQLAARRRGVVNRFGNL
ncbi:MAG TPA: DUF1214 domain-containing protein [Rubrivivax sp.]|nr:DUF1214 domain-containing protein [Pseudomonadota bacterium]HPP82356.1 DUF1214 domain-containing protein [Rubrivivax sp.]